MKPTIEELEATLNLFKNAVKILDVKSDKPAVLSLNDCNAVCFAITQAIAIEKGESVVVRKDDLRFPTMLRKMWSGQEVQKWIDEKIAAAQEGAKDE